MLKKLFLLVCLSLGIKVMARQDPTVEQPNDSGSHLRVSLITCGPADNEIWEVFGHTAIRVVDSSQKLDLVYGYGTFEFGPGFELQFMRGKLLYYISVIDFSSFMPEYAIAHRSVEEQVLNLTTRQKEEIYDYLNRNAEPAHRYYKYDFFFDNCATRIRNVFPRALGGGFKYGPTMPAGARITYRDIMNQYFYRDHWTRTGVNLLLGSKIDRPMSNEDIMFLPDYLRVGMKGATLNGAKVADTPVTLLPGSEMSGAGVNWTFVVTCIAALLTLAGLTMKPIRWLGDIMISVLMVVTGLLGCLMLVMWFGTDHQGCSNNYNLLWCLPTNLVMAFAKPKGRGKYALIAIILLFVSLLLHLLKVQGLTLLELGPLFLALLFGYGMIYKKSKLNTRKYA